MTKVPFHQLPLSWLVKVAVTPAAAWAWGARPTSTPSGSSSAVSSASTLSGRRGGGGCLTFPP